ncbi:UNVERIFIED_CONTAM: hypothetical protein FKN15_022168 [Acipenser sinensis]
MPPSERVPLLLWEVFLVVFINSKHHYVSGLEVQQIFKSADPTNNFAVNEVSNKVYLASVNRIYQLDGNLSLEIEEKTGPVLDNMLCHAPQLPHASCEHPKVLTDNYNKLLQLDRDQHVVVVCGSVYQGFCELRKLENVSEIAVEFPPQGDHKLQSEHLDCGAAHLQHPLALRNPLKASPVFESSGLTAVAVASVNDHTIVFLGTATGRLQKLNLLKNLTLGSQKAIRVASRESVHHIMSFDPSDNNYLYLMTSHQMIRVKVAKCDQYQTCNQCLGAVDAYCGWCTLESRCSLQRECTDWKQPHFWISLSEGIDMCPSMTITPSEINLASYLKDVGILINGSVPDLNRTKVECDYGNGVSTEATIYGIDSAPSQIHSCPFLPKEKYPEFPPGQDHVTIRTTIKVNGMSIVRGNVTIYDCERTGMFNGKTACTSCLNTKWKCYWNVKTYACVSSDLDSKDLLEDSASCPKLIPATLDPIATGTTQDIIFSLANTETLQLFTTENSQQIPVHLRLKEHPDKFIDSPIPMTVEVYNCMSGSTDCSQCWGREDRGHRCVWCENSCRMRSECKAVQESCSAPEIRKIEPLSGPLEGGTLLTIQGRNLGRRFSDITVSIGGVGCRPLQDRYIVSEVIVCETEKAPAMFSDVVSVIVGTEGKSRETFSYLNPEVTSIEPNFGAKAGGTKVIISGKNLDVGSRIRVLVNGTKECTSLLRTQDTIKCTMPAALLPKAETMQVCVQFEGNPCPSSSNSTMYTYMENPVISEISPKTSHICAVQSPTIITCPSPAASNSTEEQPVKFYINGVLYTGDGSAVHSLPDYDDESHTGSFYMHYCEDPHFYIANKERWIKHHHGEPLTLVIMVQVGNFKEEIARVHLGGNEMAIIVSIVVCSILLLVCTVALGVFCTKSRRAERYWQKTLLQMEEMESQIRDEIRKGFAELQTDMTDLTKELNSSQGIPFLEYKHFVTRTFFPKCSDYERSFVQPIYQNHPQAAVTPQETHPLLQDWKSSSPVKPNMEEGIALFSTLLNNKHFLVTFVHALEQQKDFASSSPVKPNMEEGIALFSTLLNNKHFLVTFVHALEQQKDFAVRDRCNIASLLTIALHEKLEYYTSIMKDLLVDLIDASASKNPKLMLRRTESVVEKMLTNWMSICMYSYLKNINVSFQGCGMDSLTVRVMNTDTICQVKEKILEAFYKNLPFSQWPRAEDLDLEWFASSNDSRILRDLDDTTLMEDGRKKLNTVLHYKVPEEASLAISLKDKRDNTLGRVKDLDTDKYFHLVLPNDELMENKKSHRQSHRKKVLPEIYLTRLLSTKGTLQKFLDDLFQAILSIPEDKPPFAVKYFFDFLEEQADKRGITDPDTLHIWKTNSLPLRFWVNILKNPQFVFDIDKTDHMDACLSVIAQAFIDACSISDLQLGKDSPTNKLLYAKEIPEYKKTVQRYYQQIQEMMPLSEQEMNAHLAEESRKYRNEFNTNSALAEIYKYAKRYQTQVVNALEANPTTKRTQLQHKFQQVIALVEDNIYECSSEA